MSTELHPFVSTEISAGDVNNYVDDLLVEKIWCDLGKQLTHEHVRQVALEIAAEFREARIMTFVPIFIHRLTLERLSNHK
ncbi:MAG: three-helix bundle dimerization domain-containing protein [Chloroflexota bacterium]